MDWNPLLAIVAVLIIGRLALSLHLGSLNRRYVRQHASEIPMQYREQITQEEYDKSVRYTLARSRFGALEAVFGATLLAVVLFSGLLPWLFVQGESLLGSTLWAHGLILFFIGVLLALPGLPLEWWETFRLEARFGFNKSTQQLWITDRLKGLLINLVIIYPLICLLLWLVRLPYWWVWAFVATFVFQLVMMVAYPMFIMPLFNKFTPLPEGELRDRLMSLADRTGFAAKTILVMDGSRRSGHSNAFFTGFGRFRRIVLFDTLIDQLSHDELEAVLAHEIGHYKLGHIPKMLIIAAIVSFAAFALLGWLAQAPWFVESFGFHHEPQHLGPALLLFGLLSGLATFWFSPIGAMWSRKHEYEADNFAKRALQGDSDPMVRALRKLHTKNLSNLTPHPLYSAFYYSHPTLIEREAALRGNDNRR